MYVNRGAIAFTIDSHWPALICSNVLWTLDLTKLWYILAPPAPLTLSALYQTISGDHDAPSMARARAVIIGTGIGGLAAAAGLCPVGWDVTACERAASLEPVGAGLALAPNGPRALDVLGAGDRPGRSLSPGHPG